MQTKEIVNIFDNLDLDIAKTNPAKTIPIKTLITNVLILSKVKNIPSLNVKSQLGSVALMTAEISTAKDMFINKTGFVLALNPFRIKGMSRCK